MAKKKQDLDASTAPASSAPSIWNVNVIMNLVTSALDAFSNPLWGGLIFAQYIFDVMGHDTRFVGAGTTLMNVTQMLLVHSVGKASDEGSKQRILGFGAGFSICVSVACIGIVILFSIEEPVCYVCYT